LLIKDTNLQSIKIRDYMHILPNEFERTKKRILLLIKFLILGFISCFIVIVILTAYYRGLIKEYYPGSLTPIYQELTLIKFFWMILLLLSFFFMNTIIWYYISYDLIKKAVITQKFDEKFDDDGIICFKCRTFIPSKISTKSISGLTPLKIFNVNGYFCEECYKHHFRISLGTIILIPIIYSLYIILIIPFLNLINLLYIPESYYYLFQTIFPVLILSVSIILIYAIIEILRFLKYMILKTKNLWFNKRTNIKLKNINKIMKIRLLLISLFVMGIIFFPVILNLTLIKSRIYYFIDYDVQGSNREEIITKVETINYTVYLNNYLEGNRGFKSYVDADFVQYLKSRIENDKNFQWEMLYEHYLRYYFIAENHSKLYLTYSNNTIFSVKDQNNNSLFLVENYDWDYVAWYLNFTQLSYVYSDNTTILLSNAIFIEIHLDYGYYCGSLCGLWYTIDQYLVLNTKLDALMIFIPHTYYVIS